MPIVASRMVSTAETRSSTGRPSQYAPSRLTASSGVVQVNTLSITSSLARERHSTPAKLPTRPPHSPLHSPRATTERGRRRESPDRGTFDRAGQGSAATAGPSTPGAQAIATSSFLLAPTKCACFIKFAARPPPTDARAIGSPGPAWFATRGIRASTRRFSPVFERLFEQPRASRVPRSCDPTLDQPLEPILDAKTPGPDPRIHERIDARLDELRAERDALEQQIRDVGAAQRARWALVGKLEARDVLTRAEYRTLWRGRFDTGDLSPEWEPTDDKGNPLPPGACLDKVSREGACREYNAEWLSRAEKHGRIRWLKPDELPHVDTPTPAAGAQRRATGQQGRMESAKKEPKAVRNRVHPRLQDAPEYPRGFRNRPGPGSVSKNTIKLKDLKAKLQKIERGEWKKVYRDGFDDAGGQVSVRYFESPSGKVFDVYQSSVAPIRFDFDIESFVIG